MKLPSLDYSALSTKPASGAQMSVSPVTKRLFIAIAASLLGVFAAGFTSHSSSVTSTMPYIVMTLVAGGVIAGLIGLYNWQRKQAAMLSAFALANNLDLQTHVSDPAYPGLMFQVGDSRKLNQRIIVPTDGNAIEIGNYQYSTGSGKNRSTHVLGFMRIKLPRRVPNMVLDSKANNFIGMFSNLPTAFNRDQVLQLEGTFNDHFTLYAPKAYERDALYVFTPDVMMALINYAGEYDIETVDNDLFIYSNGAFNLSNANTWQALLGLASKLSPEFEEQTDRYADERVANRAVDFVAQPGQRLKRGYGKYALVGIVLYIGFNSFKFMHYSDNGLMQSLGALAVVFSIVVSILVWKLLQRRQ